MAQTFIKITPTFKSLIDKLGNDIDAGFTAAMNRVVAAVEGESLDEVPVVTSNLLNSISSFVTDGGSTGVIKATAEYAKFVHDGTKAHIIRPKSPGGVLAFQVGGRTVFARKVNHPGTKADPFFDRAVAKVDVGEEFETGLGDFLKGRNW